MEKNEHTDDGECNCDKWKFNIPKLNGVIHLATIHGADVTGDNFAYCPWCGKSLYVEKD